MRKTVAGLGLALLIAAGVAAQVRERERVREKETTRTTTTTVRKVTAIIGTKVSLKDDSLGKVTDIVINEDGCIDYLIIADAEEYIAVPWGAVRYDVSERTITVTSTVTREKLKSVRFRSSSWPDFYSEKWRRSAGQVWGEKSLRRDRDGARDKRDGVRDKRDGVKDKRPVQDRPLDKRPPVKEKDKKDRKDRRPPDKP
jgi:hypothetical protein